MLEDGDTGDKSVHKSFPRRGSLRPSLGGGEALSSYSVSRK
jgi:hypothetical protein